MNGYLKIVGAALIWGSVGVIVRGIDLPVMVLTLYRVIFASLAIYLYIASTKNHSILKVGQNIYRLVLMGVILTVNWVAFFYAIKLTTVANASLLTYTAPILVAILAPVFLKERLERITIITLGISLAGVFLIAWPSVGGAGSNDTAGFLWAALSSVTYAALVIIAKPMTGKANVLAIIFYEELTCSVVLLPSFLIYDFHVDIPTLLLLLMLGTIQTALAAGLYLSGLRDVKAQHVGIFTYLDPVGAMVLAALLLNEIPSIATLVGGALIVLSGILLVIIKRAEINPGIVGE
jgi:drug/metabolite transporter (DMT)-like permease